jgi:hypothetical protein
VKAGLSHFGEKYRLWVRGFAAVTLKFTAFWDVTSALQMEAAGSSETLVNLYQTARFHIPSYINLYNHRCENLRYLNFQFMPA